MSQDEVFPYRYGSYFVYEANNKTKQFKVATFVNTTSQDSVALFPQFMYQSLLKTATGNPDLRFEVTSVPFAHSTRQRDKEEEASGIFVTFVIGIGFSLIPASIVTRLVSEKERGLFHMQIVSGVEKISYYGAFVIFDLIVAYIPCVLTILMIHLFRLNYTEVWRTIMLYPLAVIPYTYASSFIFDKESTAQTFTIYLHFLLSGIACMIVFALRMVDVTSLEGDAAMWVMRFINPTFSVCNSIMYQGCHTLLSQQRETIRRDLYATGDYEQPQLPDRIERYFGHPSNMGGDWYGLITISVVFWIIFYKCEGGNWNKFEQWMEGSWFSYLFISRFPKQKDDKELALDNDVKREEERVAQCEKHSVCVNRFRKVYSVPLSKPILAVEKASFAVNEGECFALLGVNGAGKSTTFKSLTNVVEPTSGKISILGQDIDKNFNDIRYRIGYCPQQQALFNSLSVLEHLEFYAHLKGLPSEMSSLLIEPVIHRLGIHKYRHVHAEKLSGGNKRKLQTAIAILGNPLIILLDEPSAGMDPGAKRFMWRVVANITKERTKSCVIITTHSMEEAEALSTKMGILVKGSIFKCFGTSQHIKDKFGEGYESEFRLRSLTGDEMES